MVKVFFYLKLLLKGIKTIETARVKNFPSPSPLFTASHWLLTPHSFIIIATIGEEKSEKKTDAPHLFLSQMCVCVIIELFTPEWQIYPRRFFFLFLSTSITTTTTTTTNTYSVTFVAFNKKGGSSIDSCNTSTDVS